MIGKSFSKAIIESGGKVIIGDISVEKGRELQEELGDKNAVFIEVDFI